MSDYRQSRRGGSGRGDDFSPVDSPTRVTVPPSPADRLNAPRYNYYAHSSGTSHSLSQSQSQQQDWTSCGDRLRQKKETQMAKDKSKVKSLEEVAFSQQSAEVPEPPRPPIHKSVKRTRSLTSFRESSDGKILIAFFDMRDVAKENINVTFQSHRLMVSWFSVTVNETEDEEGRVVIEKVEKNYQRTLPLPEGTKFEEIRGTMNGRHLVLRLPNSRAFKVQNASCQQEVWKQVATERLDQVDGLH
ncbi:hypothetical protein F5146DRAFT_998406 [Armillaria mellea]|nr:hypothetical protein F5146DRAFT_998406 [Armillaria mellea]